MKKLLKLTAAIGCIIAVFGCKSTGNVVQVEAAFTQNAQVISPNNDTKQDELVLTLNVKTVNFVRYWQLEILNEEKILIKSIGTEEPLEKLQKTLFMKKENIQLPESVVWDGKDKDGKLSQDGKYYFRFIVMDSKKNIFSTEQLGLGVVYIDTVKPAAEYSVENQLFSPNNDGNKDTLKYNITFKEDEFETKYPELKGKDWNVDILDNQDKIVKTFKLNDKDLTTTSVEWNGQTDKNTKAADGLYSIRLTGTDKGGNSWETSLNNVVIDTVESPVKVSWENGIFSPNNDGENDSVKFDLTYTEKENIVGWTFAVISQKDKNVLKTFSGQKDIKDSIIWDGKSDKNVFAEEGLYTGKLEIKYFNGNLSKGESLPVVVDLTPPESQSTTEISIFSPDDNDVNDKIIIKQGSSDEKAEWNGYITDKSGKTVATFNWQKKVPDEVKWDGKNEQGTTLPDGEYFYQLKSKDLAGNKYQSEKLKIVIDTKKSEISVDPKELSFSPNKDATSDTISFALGDNSTPENPIIAWTFSVTDKSGETVFEDAKTGVMPKDYTWNGSTNSGTTPADGEYTANVKTTTKLGVTTTKSSKPFIVDLTGPAISLTRSTNLFSPDNDGENDTITLGFSNAEDKTGFKDWKITITNPITKREFISFSGTGTPSAPITWDGIGKNGKLVESVQDYPITFTATDLVGNKSSQKFDPIVVDLLIIKLSDGRYKIKVSNINFQPEKAQMTPDQLNKTILNKLAKAMKKFADYNITIEGYANEFRKGLDEKAAEKLALARAETVAGELVKLGVNKTKLTSVGLGFKNPIIPLKDKMTAEEKEEMAINRRVEFYLSK